MIYFGSLKKILFGLQCSFNILNARVILISPFTSGLILLIIGTAGLFINEFIFDWGGVATIIFAAMNVIGLIFLGYANWAKKGKKS